MPTKTDVLKAPADGRYDRGWCEPGRHEAKRRTSASRNTGKVVRGASVRKAGYVNPGNVLSHYVKDMQPDNKPSFVEKYGSYAFCAMAPGLCLFGALSGCSFDTSGLPPSDRDGQVDTGVPPDGEVDSSIDTGTSDGDAQVPLGEPPVITWPKVAQLTNGTHVNNRIYWRLRPPQTAPAGRTIVGMEVDHTRNGAFVQTIAVDLAEPYGTIDATQPYAVHELSARAVYDDGTSSDATSLAVPTDGSLVVRLGMNEGQGTILHDDSGHALDADLVGFTPGSEWTQGLYGDGVMFNGASTFADFNDIGASSDATAFDSMNFNGTVPFTVEAVVNRVNTGACSTVISRFDLDKGWSVTMDGANHLFFAAYGNYVSNDSIRAQSVQTFDVPGVERHLTVSFGGSPTGSDVLMSVDGAPIPVEVLSFPLVASTANDQASTLVGAYIPAGGSDADAACVLEGGLHYLAVYRRPFSSPADARHTRCAFLASESTVPLPADCD